MDYLAYLKSYDWQIVRSKALKRYGYRCAICNKGGKLEVHHRTYERLGQEADYDVIPLCPKCHGLVSGEMPSWFDWLGKVASRVRWD